MPPQSCPNISIELEEGIDLKRASIFANQIATVPVSVLVSSGGSTKVNEDMRTTVDEVGIVVATDRVTSMNAAPDTDNMNKMFYCNLANDQNNPQSDGKRPTYSSHPDNVTQLTGKGCWEVRKLFQVQVNEVGVPSDFLRRKVCLMGYAKLSNYYASANSTADDAESVVIYSWMKATNSANNLVSFDDRILLNVVYKPPVILKAVENNLDGSSDGGKTFDVLRFFRIETEYGDSLSGHPVTVRSLTMKTYESDGTTELSDEHKKNGQDNLSTIPGDAGAVVFALDGWKSSYITRAVNHFDLDGFQVSQNIDSGDNPRYNVEKESSIATFALFAFQHKGEDGGDDADSNEYFGQAGYTVEDIYGSKSTLKVKTLANGYSDNMECSTNLTIDHI